MIILGITGSIGMGKSTISAMLEREGVPVHSADDAVHELMQPGQPGMKSVAAAFPYFEFPQIYKKQKNVQQIDRKALGDLVFKKPDLRTKLENILHPLVRAAQQNFIRTQKNMGRKIVALDIPLLFETGAEKRLDFVIVASAPFHVQTARVLDRPGMIEEKFHSILESQMPDGEKCARADFVVQTGLGRAYATKQIKEILRRIPPKKAKAAEEKKRKPYE